MIYLELTDGRIFGFPADRFRILSQASENQRNSTLSELKSRGAVLLNQPKGNDFANGFTPQPLADPAMDLRQGHTAAIRARGKKRPAAAPLRPVAPACASPARPEN